MRAFENTKDAVKAWPQMRALFRSTSLEEIWGGDAAKGARPVALARKYWPVSSYNLTFEGGCNQTVYSVKDPGDLTKASYFEPRNLSPDSFTGLYPMGCFYALYPFVETDARVAAGSFAYTAAMTLRQIVKVKKEIVSLGSGIPVAYEIVTPYREETAPLKPDDLKFYAGGPYRSEYVAAGLVILYGGAFPAEITRAMKAHTMICNGVAYRPSAEAAAGIRQKSVEP